MKIVIIIYLLLGIFLSFFGSLAKSTNSEIRLTQFDASKYFKLRKTLFNITLRTVSTLLYPIYYYDYFFNKKKYLLMSVFLYLKRMVNYTFTKWEALVKYIVKFVIILRTLSVLHTDMGGPQIVEGAIQVVINVKIVENSILLMALKGKKTLLKIVIAVGNYIMTNPCFVQVANLKVLATV